MTYRPVASLRTNVDVDLPTPPTPLCLSWVMEARISSRSFCFFKFFAGPFFDRALNSEGEVRPAWSSVSRFEGAKNSFCGGVGGGTGSETMGPPVPRREGGSDAVDEIILGGALFSSADVESSHWSLEEEWLLFTEEEEESSKLYDCSNDTLFTSWRILFSRDDRSTEMGEDWSSNGSIDCSMGMGEDCSWNGSSNWYNASLWSFRRGGLSSKLSKGLLVGRLSNGLSGLDSYPKGSSRWPSFAFRGGLSNGLLFWSLRLLGSGGGLSNESIIFCSGGSVLLASRG
mmetsp:Transcript_18879/g.35123  ORF Transcript_18879/g.35123 Transcript_18879/m.35123 type:complete len:286 (-) Transcript_18879:45-902(-)